MNELGIGPAKETDYSIKHYRTRPILMDKSVEASSKRHHTLRTLKILSIIMIHFNVIKPPINPDGAIKVNIRIS